MHRRDEHEPDAGTRGSRIRTSSRTSCAPSDPDFGSASRLDPHEPAIRAVDCHGERRLADGRLHRPPLHEERGTTGCSQQQSSWAWDRAPDEQLEDFGPNFWQSFGRRAAFQSSSIRRRRASTGSRSATTGTGSNSAADQEKLDWASYHFGHYGSAGEDSCNFPGPPPPDGNYAGTTDEGKAITFDGGADLEQPVPRPIGGSRLTQVTIRSTLNCTPSGTLNYFVTAAPTRWIQLNADNTFAYVRVGSLNDSNAARSNVTGSYYVAGKIDTAGNASGSLYFQQLSYDENGTHYTCAGTAHSWTAKRSS